MPSTLRFSPRRRSSDKICAQVQSALARLELLFRVEEDCDGAFIDEFHGHHSLEDPGCDGDAEAAKGLAKFFVELLGELGWGSGNEAGATLATRIAIECELRDDERGSLYV